MSLPFISIVSINWNSVNDTLALLMSISKSDYPKSKYEVIVVDNGSTDRSAKIIKKKFVKTKLITLDKNIGVSARNYAFRKAKGEIIITADSDAILQKDSIRMAILLLQNHPKIGILGGKVLNKKYHKEEFSPMKLNFFTGTIKMLNPNAITTKSTFLPFIFTAIPKNTIEKIGLLDTAFFFYGDDLDFCMRVKRAGLDVVYDPKIYVFHAKNKATPDIPHSIKYHHYYKSLFRNIYKYGNLVQKMSVIFFQLILIPLYRFLVKRENTFAMRWWGFWWNVKKSSHETKLFLVALFVSIILHAIALGQRDFWFDEAFTYHIARLPLRDLFAVTLTDNNPPLYYLLIHFILKVSSNEVVLRFPSLLLNLATTVVLYSIVKKYINRKLGFIAASLFSLSSLSLYLATEGRPHGMGTLLVLLIIGSFLAFINNPKLKRNAAIFSFFSIIGFYTHFYTTLLLLPFSWIIYRRSTKNITKNWLIILTVLLFVFAPWVILSLQNAHSSCSCPPTLLSLPSILVSPVLGGVGEVTVRVFPTLPLPVLLLFGIVTAITFFLFLKGLAQNRLIALLYLMPLVALGLFGLFFPVFSPKAFSVFSPIYFAIIALGITYFRKSGPITIFIAILLGTISLIQITNPFFAGTKLKPVNSIIKTSQNIPVAHTSLLTYYSLDYYSQGNQKHILITQNPLSIETLRFIGGQKQEVNVNMSQLWLVDTEKWTETNDRENAIKTVSDAYSVEKTYKIDNISVILLKRK